MRTEAGRLRARLNEYYLGDGKSDLVLIEMPRGGYIPLIRHLPVNLEVIERAPRFRRPKPWLFGGLSILTLVLGALLWGGMHRNAPIPIAVLPLVNLSEDRTSDYFVDGMTGEIIRNLSIIDGLVVRSQTSSFAFKGKPRNIGDAGKQLGAEYIVEGSVLRAGDQLRINAQLVRVRDDATIWSGRYDRDLTDVFAIQDQISRGIVNSLRLRLGRGRRRYETSAEAYDLYLRARALGGAGELGVGGFRPSIPLFEQAIEKDPTFAPAYAGLAVAHAILSSNSSADIPAEMAKMRTAAEKAVELDPLSPEAYDALGTAYARQALWSMSERSFVHAIELQPDRAESHTHFAAYLLLPLGRIDEAIRHLQAAEKNDPLSSLLHYWLADALADEGRNAEAENVCKKLSPLNDHKEACVLGAQVRQGAASDVIRFYERDPSKAKIGPALGCAYARAGRRPEAELVFAATKDITRAQILSCLGDKNRVFEVLDHDAAVGPIRMGWILNRVDREHRGLLQGDPRLEALRKKVGLP